MDDRLRQPHRCAIAWPSLLPAQSERWLQWDIAPCVSFIPRPRAREPPAETSLSVAELEPATPYIFRVRGRGTFAWGPFSAPSEALSTTGEPLSSLGGGASAFGAGADPAAVLEEALLAVRKEIWALKYLSAEAARTAVRKLKMRYHPDKAPADRRELFLELSKVINTETGQF